MNYPFQPLFSTFHLHDDYARVVFPLFIAAMSWGFIGGGLASLLAWAGRQRRGRKPLTVR